MMLKWILGLIGENSWEFRDDKKTLLIYIEEEEEMGYAMESSFSFGLEGAGETSINVSIYFVHVGGKENVYGLHKRNPPESST